MPPPARRPAGPGQTRVSAVLQAMEPRYYSVRPMASAFPCPECSFEVPNTAERCPHCARPGFFPNVRAAEAPENQAALALRFDTARAEACTRGAEAVFDSFTAEVDGSHAVWCKPWGELLRLASRDKQGAGTYYQQIEAEMRVPDGDRWDALRRITDEALFPGYKDNIRFAALSLDHTGPRSYGPTTLTFRTDLIAHRASVFEENTVVFMERRDVKLKDAPSVATGFKAPWGARGQLAAAKLGTRLSPSTLPTEFAGLLMQQGPTSADEDFVEVHIYGPVTIRTFESAIADLDAVKRGEGARPTKGQVAMLRDRLAGYNVKLEVRP